MAQFEVSQPDSDEVHLRESKDASATSVERLFPGDTIDILPNADEDSAWVFAKLVTPGDDGSEGWLETKFQGAELDPLDYPQVAPEAFVRACARYELATNSGGEPTPAAYADYLIAWALIESELKNFAPQVDGSDANGPFQIGSAEWQEFLDAQGTKTFYTAEHRFRANLQIAGAGFLAERDREAFIAAVTAAGGTASEGEPVPGDTLVASFLNLLHCRMLGVPGAAMVAELHKDDGDDDPNTPMDKVLAETVPDAARDGIIKRYKRFVKPGVDFLTVDAFYTKTEDALNEAFKKAVSLFKEHASEFLPPPPAGASAPWLAIAETERDQHWRDANEKILKENDSAATVARVVQYFKSTSFKPDVVHHWCGAFVAHCLNQVGGRIAESVIKDGARAANWKAWGDRELRIMGNIPKGAVVVLKPGRGTGGSGHVGFFMGFLQGSDRKKIELLGGNQSDTVKVSTFETSQVAAIRWFGDYSADLEAGDTTPVAGPGAVAGATENDVLVLARTLYGEARGEPDAGRKAVANVILNRTGSARYPNTVAKVCLQPWQFSTWNKNDPNREKILRLVPGGGDAVFDELFAIARSAIEGNIPDAVDGALHYHANHVNPKWAKSPPAVVTKRIGRHIFYKGVQ